MLALQIASALLLFLNKFYVRQKKAIGWIYGIWGAIVITIYFYLQMVLQQKANLWIMIVLDIALVILMSYGYLVARAKDGDRLKDMLKKWNVVFKTIVVSLSIIVCGVLLFGAITSKLVILQFIFATSALFATLLLAFDKKAGNIIGWALYFIGHIVCTYLMFKTDSPIIAIFQIFSAYIAIDGIRNELKK